MIASSRFLQRLSLSRLSAVKFTNIADTSQCLQSNVWLLFVAEQEDNTHEKNRDTEPKEYHSVLSNQNELKEAKMLREFKRSCRVG